MGHEAEGTLARTGCFDWLLAVNNGDFSFKRRWARDWSGSFRGHVLYEELPMVLQFSKIHAAYLRHDASRTCLDCTGGLFSFPCRVQLGIRYIGG